MISTLKSFAKSGRSSGPGRTTTLYPWARYLSATWFRRCSIFMTSLREWEWVYRVFDAHVHELRTCLECRHKGFGYYPGTEEAHTNPTRQRGECLRALAGASGSYVLRMRNFLAGVIRTQNPEQTRPQPPVERGWADKADSRPVGWGTGARTLGSGGNSTHFKVGLSPAPMATFPAAPPKIPYGGFSPVRLQVPGTAQFSRESSRVGRWLKWDPHIRHLPAQLALAFGIASAGRDPTSMCGASASDDSTWTQRSSLR